MFSEIFIRILSSIIGGTIVNSLFNFRKSENAKSSDLTRKLIQKIVKSNDETSQDSVELIHYPMDDTMEGTIYRALPIEENGLKWKFQGKKIGNNIFLIFWPDSPKAESSGSILLKYSPRKEFYEGYYTKFVTQKIDNFSGDLSTKEKQVKNYVKWE